MSHTSSTYMPPILCASLIPLFLGVMGAAESRGVRLKLLGRGMDHQNHAQMHTEH